MKPDKNNFAQRYRRLVVAEVSDDALSAAVALAMEIAGVGGVSIGPIDEQLAALDRDESLDEHERRHLADDILEYMSASREARKKERQSRRLALTRRRLAGEAAFCLGLPAWLETRPDHAASVRAGLLLDTAVVVFHQVYFGVWLSLGNGDDDLRQLLERHAMQLAARLPPADRARTQALVLEGAGHPSMADSFRDEALQLTRPSSHEYMTVLQSAWAGLIERKQFPQAALLLVREAPRVPPEHLEEFEELVLETTRMRRAA